MREKTSFFPGLCCALIWLAPMACTPQHEPFDRPPPPLFGFPGLENCGYPLAPEISGELDPCADEQTVLQERTVNTWVFEDPTAVYAFDVPEAGQVCIRVQIGDADGSHRPWWGKVELDGRTVFGRNQLHQGRYELSQTLEVEAGSHELAVTLYGPRRSFVDVAVGFAPQASASGYSRTSRNGTMTIDTGPFHFQLGGGATFHLLPFLDLGLETRLRIGVPDNLDVVGMSFLGILRLRPCRICP